MQILAAIIGVNTLVLGVLVKLFMAYGKDQRDIWKAAARTNDRVTRVETRLTDHLENHKQWEQRKA